MSKNPPPGDALPDEVPPFEHWAGTTERRVIESTETEQNVPLDQSTERNLREEHSTERNARVHPDVYLADGDNDDDDITTGRETPRPHQPDQTPAVAYAQPYLRPPAGPYPGPPVGQEPGGEVYQRQRIARGTVPGTPLAGPETGYPAASGASGSASASGPGVTGGAAQDFTLGTSSGSGPGAAPGAGQVPPRASGAAGSPTEGNQPTGSFPLPGAAPIHNLNDVAPFKNPNAPAPYVDPSEAMPSRSSRNLKRWLAVGIPVAIVLIVGLTVAATLVVQSLLHSAASDRYDSALTALDPAVVKVEDVLADTTAAEADAQVTVDSIGKTITAALPDYVPADATTDLSAVKEDVAGVAATSGPDLTAALAALPSPDTKPEETADLNVAAERMEDSVTELNDTVAEAEERLDAFTAATEPLGAAITALTGAARTRADEIVAGNPSASFRTRIDLDTAKAGMKSVTDVANLPGEIGGYVTAAQALEAAHAAREAMKSDPMYSTRVEVETYANSLALGLRLDFNWAPIVSGSGGANSFGGHTSATRDDGGLGTIDFSYSVAEMWAREPGVKALVAHEVGHAVAVLPQCWPLFDGESFRRDNEAWATAWAFSHGFEGNGAGDLLYGRPTADQVAVAATCR